MLYKNPFLYNSAMRLLYGSHLSSKYEAVLDFIKETDSVLDVCCGPVSLAPYLPADKKYLGIDNSLAFQKQAFKKGIPFQLANAFFEPLPSSFQVVTLLSSLYQFKPHTQTFINKLLSLAEDKLIITEPIANVSSSKLKALRLFAKYMTEPQDKKLPYLGERFDLASLEQEMNPYQDFVIYKNMISNQREMIFVLDAKRWKERQ